MRSSIAKKPSPDTEQSSAAGLWRIARPDLNYSALLHTSHAVIVAACLREVAALKLQKQAEVVCKCFIAADIARWSSPDLCRPVDERDIEKGLVTMQAVAQQAQASAVVVPGAAQAGRP